MTRKFRLLVSAFILFMLATNAHQSGIQKSFIGEGNKIQRLAIMPRRLKWEMYISGTVATMINPESITNLYKNLEKRCNILVQIELITHVQ